jgi:hypothetical protein
VRVRARAAALTECTAFLERVQASEKCAGRDIGAFLILPIQRIPRYVLLLQELLKNTPTAHADRAPLEQALVQMRDVADYVNERKREAENLSRVSQVSKMLTGKFEPVNAPHRRFVRQVRVTACAHDRSSSHVRVRWVWQCRRRRSTRAPK